MKVRWSPESVNTIGEEYVKQVTVALRRSVDPHHVHLSSRNVQNFDLFTVSMIGSERRWNSRRWPVQLSMITSMTKPSLWLVSPVCLCPQVLGTQSINSFSWRSSSKCSWPLFPHLRDHIICLALPFVVGLPSLCFFAQVAVSAARHTVTFHSTFPFLHCL